MSRRDRRAGSGYRRTGRSHGSKKKGSFRDRIHDYNDILLAVVIILVAAFLVAWRLQAILNYPAVMAQQKNSTSSSQETSALPESPDSPVEVMA